MQGMVDMRTSPASVRHPNLLPRRRLHRTAFLAAGLYNLGWGLHAAVDPQWLFRFARMPPQNHPEVFACLGMVIGLYGVLYLEVARLPEQNWPVAAIGMAGKLLGPLGFAHLPRGSRAARQVQTACRATIGSPSATSAVNGAE